MQTNDSSSNDEVSDEEDGYIDAFDLIGVDGGKPLQDLLVAAGQYLKWPLHPFPCDGKEKAEAEFRRIVMSSSSHAGGGGGGSLRSFAPDPYWLQSFIMKGGEEQDQRQGDDAGKSGRRPSIWDGLYADVVPGTDFVATMDLLSASRTCIEDSNSPNEAATAVEDEDSDGLAQYFPSCIGRVNR